MEDGSGTPIAKSGSRPERGLRARRFAGTAGGGRGSGPPTAKSGSRLERVLRARRFAVTAEVVPPASPDPAPLVAAARKMKGAADAFTVTDSPRARGHMASW